VTHCLTYICATITGGTGMSVVSVKHNAEDGTMYIVQYI